MAEIHRASGATRHGAKALLAQLFHRLSVAPLGGRVRSRPRAAPRDQAPRLYRQLLPSGAASGEMAPRKRRQSRNVASGSRANDSADNDDPTVPCAVDPATGWTISPIVAASLCIKPRGLLTPRQAAKVDALKSASADFTAMRRLAMRFRGILRSKDIQKFGVWLDDAQQSGILRHAALRPNSAARSRRRHKRVDRGVEQRPNRRADQSTEDPQARDVRSRRRRTATSPNVASPLADSARKVRQTPFDGFFGVKFDILKPRWLPTAGDPFERAHLESMEAEARG